VDFRLFFSVLRRFKHIVAAGLLIAFALAFLTFFKVGLHGLGYREQQKWADTARVLVTTPNGGQDPTSLAQVYAALATSDEVTKAAIMRHRVPGVLVGDFGYVNRTSTALPTISVTAVSTNPRNAALLANDAVAALRVFVRRQQSQGGIPLARQAKLQTLNTAIPFRAQVYAPRSKTPPVIVFVLVLAATIGLVFLLENLRPRARSAPVVVEPTPSYIDARRARDQA
jgi:hypothetical protein